MIINGGKQCCGILLDLDKFKTACCEGWASQDVLRKFVCDPSNCSADRTSAAISYGWISSNGNSVEERIQESVWAAGFIKRCFSIMHPVYSSAESAALVYYYGNAIIRILTEFWQYYDFGFTACT
jgi:hypothetical protein